MKFGGIKLDMVGLLSVGVFLTYVSLGFIA